MKNFFIFLLYVLFPIIILAFFIWLTYVIGESDLPLWVKFWLLRG